MTATGSGQSTQVEALAQEVDADEHVELAFAQGAQNLNALDGVNLSVEVADVDPEVAQVIGELLGGAPGEGGDEDALLASDKTATLRLSP